jgi:hypothetical protein
MEFIVTSYKDRRKSPCEAAASSLRHCFDPEPPNCLCKAHRREFFWSVRVLFWESTVRGQGVFGIGF